MTIAETPMRWVDLPADPDILAALEHAGVRSDDANQDQKRRWSERFADGCAVAIANQFRRAKLSGKTIKPLSLESGTEPLTPLGAGMQKRLDVTVTSPMLGLEIGVSLKGLNYRDAGSNNFDKNLTGRLYEMSDECRLVHEHVPHAFMVGVFFLPIASCSDKTDAAPSSFASAVRKLQGRTGRLDAALSAQASKCDASFVALYALGDEGEGFTTGAARFFRTSDPPPRRGRPKVSSTLSLAEFIGHVVDLATNESYVSWSEPELT